MGENNLKYVARRREQGSNHVTLNGSAPGTAPAVFGPAAFDTPGWVSPTASEAVPTTGSFVSPNHPNRHLPSVDRVWSSHPAPNPLSLDDPAPWSHDELVEPTQVQRVLVSESDSAYYTESKGVAQQTNDNEDCYMGMYWPLPSAHQLDSVGQMGTFPPDMPMVWDMDEDLDNLPPEAPDGVSG
jgi:hypothetical protein